MPYFSKPTAMRPNYASRSERNRVTSSQHRKAKNNFEARPFRPPCLPARWMESRATYLGSPIAQIIESSNFPPTGAVQICQEGTDNGTPEMADVK